MIATILMLLLLIGSYLLLAGLVCFCEDIITPSVPSVKPIAAGSDRKNNQARS